MTETHASPPSHLARHFADATQQFESSRLGMWIFLSTEVLLFGGLFCAYAVYRGIHPEIFYYGHRYLDVTLGGVNTLILITSSLTMAWAVRSAQLGRRTALVALLALTLLGGSAFLGIKYVEYQHKWKEGLLPGKHYRPHSEPVAGRAAEGPGAEGVSAATQAPSVPDAPPAAGVASPTEEHTTIPPPGQAPLGLATGERARPADDHATERPRNVQLFFGVYFLMTGLHGLHVIAGILVIAWILIRSVKGEFGSSYFTPVDLVGLYWHLVDLIWIFLFPLLYLIH